ncbi:hypothetical protein [Clostridium sp. C2-6-12]|uniref:hypothetical protein n=1 Tax=Clostridium sp. C2-6-12 TaxID=2698832 RepID=UPI00136F2A81|nr:hypothetical protein [Clostridium sp. C2-6-12]
MSEKLLIAKYKEVLIKYSEYQKSIHEGKLYCPFCDPAIRVTYNIKGFFMAWKNEGGHNCGKAREQAKYLDPDWKGRKLIEISRNQEGDLEITIDINTLVYPKRKSIAGGEDNTDGLPDKKGHDIFPIYKEREEVFRDVVRSVYQMKRILENNRQEFLRGLNFKFRTSDGVLSLNDAVIRMHELNCNIVGKSRFVMFMVNNIVTSNGVIYINAYSAKGINLSAKLKYPYKKNPFNKLEGEYAIAYGKITYSDKSGKYFVTLTNDFQIRKLKEDVGSEFFDDIEFEEYNYKAFVKSKENSETINNKEDEVLKNRQNDIVRQKINKPTTNNIKVERQDNYIQKSILVNENNKPEPNILDEVEIKRPERVEHRSKYEKDELSVVDSDGMISKVKKFIRNLISK